MRSREGPTISAQPNFEEQRPERRFWYRAGRRRAGATRAFPGRTSRRRYSTASTASAQYTPSARTRPTGGFGGKKPGNLRVLAPDEAPLADNLDLRRPEAAAALARVLQEWNYRQALGL